MKHKKRRAIIAVFVLSVLIFALVQNADIENEFGYVMFDYIKQYSFQHTGVYNIVTAVYLNYRYFDTLIEAFVLMFATIAVSDMSLHKKEGKRNNEK